MDKKEDLSRDLITMKIAAAGNGILRQALYCL